MYSIAHYYGKKKTKRIGRPPGGHTNLDISTKEGSRRKKRKPLFVHKKKHLSTSVDSTPAGSPLVLHILTSFISFNCH